MPQLQINQGPQDALLYDNSRSYFTNVGYARTSNFQVELRDVDSQNTANLGSTVQFVIPKAADLLGPVDLVVKMNAASAAPGTAGLYNAWVESVGLAMIERITFSVGSHDVETITGEQLNIINELMRSDEQRLGSKQIGKTGRGATSAIGMLDGSSAHLDEELIDTESARIISHGTSTVAPGAKLIIPLGLFFTKHPSQYFPLAAIAGCNDVRISIKFRSKEQLVVSGSTYPTGTADAVTYAGDSATGAYSSPSFAGKSVFDSAKLRCHYVHVTGPEATTLMNKEHVRLLKLWHNQQKTFMIKPDGTTAAGAKSKKLPIDLSFLHPVQELIITVRKASEAAGSTSGTAKPSDEDQLGLGTNYFAYHGSGKDPNVESWENRLITTTSAGVSKSGSDVFATAGKPARATLKVNAFKLSLNGQERHPSLAAEGIDRDYLMDRLMPMLHSNTSHTFNDLGNTNVTAGQTELDFKHLGEMYDRKEIYVYPFALNPEGANPSGAVNFSKVSHAKLEIDVGVFGTGTEDVEWLVDVYGVYYNWLQIKDGRALTSFA